MNTGRNDIGVILCSFEFWRCLQLVDADPSGMAPDLQSSRGDCSPQQEAAMFSLTVIDHVRLDCEHAAQNYTVHARAADRFATLAFAVRMIMAMLLAAAAAACIAGLILPDRFYAAAAATASSAAMIGFSLYSVLGLEGRVSAHRAFAHRLWLVCEGYRSLIAEANDGLVDGSELLARRDHLIQQLHAIYERGFSVDQSGYEAARLGRAPSERAA
jgi:hypothetical protein